MPTVGHPASKPILDVTGRVALVTGASRGIGRAVALGLAAHGADVIVHYASRSAEAGTAAAAIEAAGRRARVLQKDLVPSGSGRALAEEAVRAFGIVDILVLNAVKSGRHPFETLGADEMEAQVSANLVANIEILQICVPAMAARGWGRVVTIGSVQQVRPNPELVVYAALKSAMVNVVMNLARNYGRRGVTFNNVAPGMIATESTAPQLAEAGAVDARRSEIALGYVGEPSDCVGPVLLMCSDAGRYITGTNLFVDGGMHLPRRAEAPSQRGPAS